jgi:hypothetical protein
VRLIADETSVLEDEALFPKAEEIILAGLAACRTWADLQRLVQCAVITVDPDGARRRREKAEREHARLRIWRENCGTCAMQATGLPTDEALGANANIEARARQYKDAGVERPMDILRVMAFTDLLNGVTVAQRAAWARASDEARRVEEADRAEKAARDAKLRRATQDAAAKTGEPGQDEGGGPGDRGDDGGPGLGPDGDGPGGPDGDCPGGADGGTSDSTSNGDSCGGNARGRPGGQGPGNDGPGGGLSGGPCPACGGAGRGIGLPIRASLTLPAGALGWLAEGAARARGPTGNQGPRGGPGPCPECGNWGGAGLPVREYLVFPLLTLLGMAERPGEAHGLGALDPGLVRDLAAAGARHPDSQFCVTIVDEQGFAVGHGCCKPVRGRKGKAIPVDPGRVTITPSGRPGPDGGFGCWILALPGAPLPFTVDIDPVPAYDCDHRYESSGYQPSDKLRHLVQVRDGKCSFPACSRQARESDFEHARPFGKGGRTCACNGHSCSRSCHRVKQSRGWAVIKPRPGWTQWTTMAGRTYTQGPWRYTA